MPRRIGLISDTHGLMRPEALAALAGVELIVHAGDIGDIGDGAILRALEVIAPVTAVRGNNDVGAWAEAIPEHAVLRVGAVTILVVHDAASAGSLLERTAPDVVVAGHSHRPLVRTDGGVLQVNPGSAGPRRFSLPVTVAHLTLDGASVRAEIVPLAVAPRR
jgi:uncharacterized protein